MNINRFLKQALNSKEQEKKRVQNQREQNKKNNLLQVGIRTKGAWEERAANIIVQLLKLFVTLFYVFVYKVD